MWHWRGEPLSVLYSQRNCICVNDNYFRDGKWLLKSCQVLLLAETGHPIRQTSLKLTVKSGLSQPAVQWETDFPSWSLIPQVRQAVMATLSAVELEDLPVVVKFILHAISGAEAVEVRFKHAHTHTDMLCNPRIPLQSLFWLYATWIPFHYNNLAFGYILYQETKIICHLVQIVCHLEFRKYGFMCCQLNTCFNSVSAKLLKWLHYFDSFELCIIILIVW